MKKTWILLGVLAVILLAGVYFLLRPGSEEVIKAPKTLYVTYNGEKLDAMFQYHGPDVFTLPDASSTHMVKADTELEFSYTAIPSLIGIFGDEFFSEKAKSGEYKGKWRFKLPMPSRPGVYPLNINAGWDLDEIGYLRTLLFVFGDLPENQSHAGLQNVPALSMTYDEKAQDISYAFIGKEDAFTVKNYDINALPDHTVKANSDVLFAFDVEPAQMIKEFWASGKERMSLNIYSGTDSFTLTMPSEPGKYYIRLGAYWSDHETGFAYIKLDVVP